MPLREYSCTICGLVVQKLISGFQPPKSVKCECGEKATLMFSVPSIVSPKDATRQENPKSDVVIGQQANKFWENYRNFSKGRKPVVEEAKRRGTGVTVDFNQGHTRVMTPAELSTRKQAYKMLGQAQKEEGKQPSKKR